MDKSEKIEWYALEYEEKERGNDWFWALGIIVVASSAAAFIYKNYFFGLFLIAGGILIYLFAVKKPDLVFYELNEKGLKIRDRLFPYENIKSFWVQAEEANQTLFIKSERQFLPIISMPIKPGSVKEIRDWLLKNKVREEEMKEHVSQRIMEWLGF